MSPDNYACTESRSVQFCLPRASSGQSRDVRKRKQRQMSVYSISVRTKYFNQSSQDNDQGCFRQFKNRNSVDQRLHTCNSGCSRHRKKFANQRVCNPFFQGLFSHLQYVRDRLSDQFLFLDLLII